MRTVGSYQAKTHLPALLSRVAQGEQIMITRHGVPIAKLVPATNARTPDVERALREMRAFRKGRRLDGLSIREMVEKGRK